MKKILFTLSFSMSVLFFGQTQMNLHIQNYTGNLVEYVVGKQAWYSTNCGASSESRSSLTGMSILKVGDPINYIPSEAFYSYKLNLSNTFNPAFPDTPLIDLWAINSNFPGMPAPSVPSFISNSTDWSYMKFGIADPAGNPLEGYFFMHVTNTPCSPIPNSTTTGPVFSINMPNSQTHGTMYTFGGDMWIVMY